MRNKKRRQEPHTDEELVSVETRLEQPQTHNQRELDRTVSMLHSIASAVLNQGYVLACTNSGLDGSSRPPQVNTISLDSTDLLLLGDPVIIKLAVLSDAIRETAQELATSARNQD